MRRWGIVAGIGGMALTGLLSVPVLFDRLFPESPAVQGCCDGWKPCPGRRSWKVKVKADDGKYRFNEYTWYCGPEHPLFQNDDLDLGPDPAPAAPARLGKRRAARPDRTVVPPIGRSPAPVAADRVEGEVRATDGLLGRTRPEGVSDER